MGKSKIEWTDKTWNPIRGCSRVSEGCRNCYAERMAARFSGPIAIPTEDPSSPNRVRNGPYHGLAKMTADGPRWTGKVRLVPEALDAPLRWRKPRKVFVNSMSDLFHPEVKDEWIAAIMNRMMLARERGHIFQVLTKRADRMRDHLKLVAQAVGGEGEFKRRWSHVWWGVSVENQKTAEERTGPLLKTPAAVRWISYEPGIGPVNLDEAVLANERLPQNEGLGIDWVVVGGESGPGARPFDLRWARSIIEQCRATGTLVFVKQLGANAVGYNGTGRFETKSTKGGDMSEWPEDLRVREFPKVSKATIA